MPGILFIVDAESSHVTSVSSLLHRWSSISWGTRGSVLLCSDDNSVSFVMKLYLLLCEQHSEEEWSIHFHENVPER